MLLPCELWQRVKLFIPIDESGYWCVRVCVCGHNKPSVQLNKLCRECELRESVAMIRARYQKAAKKGWVGGWVERANAKCGHVSRCVEHPDARVWSVADAGTVKRRVDARKRRELPKVLRTRVSVDVGGERHCVLLMRCSE
jgi:hypothetical protein